ncbi:MAG: GntR family transcriptional regulator [Acidimicrobiales bacterium]
MAEYEHHVDPIGARPQLKDLAFERLREFIVTGRLAPGETIREAAWSAHLGVSKTPIREAFVRLEQEGFVRLEPYRGAIVSGYDANDIDEIFEVREILEGAMARRVAQTKPAGIIDRLQANLSCGEAALSAGDHEEAGVAMHRFDTILFSDIGNARLEAVIDQIRSHVQRIGCLAAPEKIDRIEDALLHQRGIIEAIANGRPAAAERLMRQHVRAVKSNAVTGMRASGTLD